MSAHQVHSESASSQPGSRPRFMALLFWFAELTFSFGIFLYVLGAIITFVPGAEQGWFTVAGVFVCTGIFVPRWYIRVAALVFAVFCASAAFKGHQSGIEYRQYI